MDDESLDDGCSMTVVDSSCLQMNVWGCREMKCRSEG